MGDKKEKEKKTGIIKVIYYNFLMLKMIFKYAPGLIFYTFFYMVVTGIRAVINTVYVQKYFVDCVQIHRTVAQIAGFIAIFIGINFIDSLLGTYYSNVYIEKKKIILSQKMQGDLFRKARDIELAAYDNPKLYNDFIWATSNADAQAFNVLKNFGDFIGSLTRIGGVGVIILSSDAVGIIVVILSLVISFLAELKVNKLDYELSLKQNPIQRERDYTSRVLYMPDYAKEIRLSNVRGFLTNNFSRVNDKLIKTIKSFGKKSIFWSFFGEGVAITFLMDLLYTLYLCYMTLVKGEFTYGTFIGLYIGIFNLRNNLNHLSKIIANFRKDSLYIGHLMDFINYKVSMPRTVKPEKIPDKPALIELKNVSFRYDGTENNVLKNINITIHSGEKIAIVGYNGAGKTTLTKLLMRLYDVTEGEILLNGINIKEYSIKDYREYFGAVFQDYKLFAGTVSENVMMDTVKESDKPVILNSLEQSGFSEKLNSFPDKEDTMLTREFDKKGTGLSGGEAQKVAIARVFAKDCKVIILDEPSSALDPVSEYNLYHSMLNAAGEKSVVFVSHRLSTTRIADRIYMFEKGEIIERGSHDELMELNGKYAQMFNLQAEKYRSNP